MPMLLVGKNKTLDMTSKTRAFIIVVIIVLIFVCLFAIENNIVATIVAIGLGVVGFVIETSKTSD